MSITAAVTLIVIVAIAAGVIYAVYESQQKTIRQNQELLHERQLLEGGFVQAVVRLHETKGQLDEDEDYFLSVSEDVCVWKKPGEVTEFIRTESPEALKR